MSKCIICEKLLDNNKKIYCSKKCENIGKRIYQRLHYRKNKPIYQNYMRNYYEEHKGELKQNSRVYGMEQRHHSYNRPLKNQIREKIVNIIENGGVKNILTLESPEFIFSKMLPEKKIYVYEISKQLYEDMLKTKPKNVVLFFGDISNFSNLDINIDCIYLDFCSSFFTEKKTILSLKEHIKNCKLFIVTFCSRTGKPYSELEIEGNYEFDLISRIQNLTETNWKILFGQSYKDNGGGTMITIVFENAKGQER